MTLKTAAFLALIGTLLLTVLALADFITTISGVMSDIIPAMKLLTSLIYTLASVSLALFFFVFYKKQP